MPDAPLLEFYRAYVRAQELLGLLYDQKRKRLRDEKKAQKENQEEFAHILTPLANVDNVLKKIAEALGKHQNIGQLTSLLDMPSKQILAMHAGVKTALYGDLARVCRPIYELSNRRTGVAWKPLKFADANSTTLYALFVELSNMERRMKEIPENVLEFFATLRSEFEERSSATIRSGKGKITVRIVYGKGATETPNDELFNEFMKQNASLREFIKLKSGLTSKIIAAMQIVVTNILLEELLGPGFRTNCTIYVEKEKEGAVGWFIRAFSKSKILAGKSVTVNVQPDSSDLRIFVLSRYIQESSIPSLASTILHELVHNLDRKLGDSMQWPDRVREEGITRFAETIEEPNTLTTVDSIIRNRKIFDTISLKDYEEYQVGLLFMLGLLDAQIRKTESESQRKNRRLREHGLGGKPFLDVYKPDYYRDIIGKRAQAQLVLRTALRLDSKAFFEWYFQQAGVPWFLSPRLCRELADILKSDKIESLLLQRAA